MIIDFILAVLGGIVTQSFIVFFVLIFLALPFIKPDQPFYSGLFKMLLIMAGISVLFSIFGGGDDCDCDL